MTQTTAQRPPSKLKPKPKQVFRFRLLIGIHCQPGKKLVDMGDTRDGVGANEYEQEVFWPGDVFETDIDLRRMDRNSKQHKYEIVHPNTPLYRKKKGDDRPMSEVWNADLETTKAPGETFDAFVERMKNLQKIKKEREEEDPDFVPDSYTDEGDDEEEKSSTMKTPHVTFSSGDEGSLTTQFNSEAPFPPPIDPATQGGEQGSSDALYPPRPPFPPDGRARQQMLTDMSNKELWNLAKELKVNFGQACKHDDMVSVLMAATDPGEQED